MGAKVSGQPSGGFVDLDVAGGDFLRYHVTLEAGAVANYAIADQYGAEIMSSAVGDIVKDWKPVQGQRSNQGQLVHSLVMVFAAADKYRWRVEHMRANGTLIALIRDLIFEQDGQTPIGTSSLTIFI